MLLGLGCQEVFSAFSHRIRSFGIFPIQVSAWRADGGAAIQRPQIFEGLFSFPNLPDFPLIRQQNPPLLLFCKALLALTWIICCLLSPFFVEGSPLFRAQVFILDRFITP